MRAFAALAICLLLWMGPAAAEEKADKKPAKPSPAKPKPPKLRPADAVLAAVKAKDKAALKTLAAKDSPDPWIVADELCERGAYDAADAFAHAAPRKATERLPAYVNSMRGIKPRLQECKTLAAVNDALAAGNLKEVLALTEAVGGPLDSVVRVRLAYGRGLARRSLRQHAEGARAFRAAGDAARALGWLSRGARAYRMAGVCAYFDTQMHSSIDAYKRAIELATAIGKRVLVAEVLGNIGNAFLRLGDYKAAFAAYEKAHDELVALKQAPTAAWTRMNIGLVHQARGNYPKALQTYQHARKQLLKLSGECQAAAKLGDERSSGEALRCRFAAAQALSNVGSTYRDLGDYPKALSVFAQALEEQRALENWRSAAGVLMSIGTIHLRLGDDTRALAELARARAEQLRVKDRGGAATALANIGGVHQRRGDYEDALDIYKKALDEQEKLSDKRAMAATLGEIGSIHLVMGDHAQAATRFDAEMKLQKELDDKVGIARAHMHVGLALVAAGKQREGIAELKDAVNQAESRRDRELQVATQRALARVYLEAGKPGKALRYADAARRELEDLLGGLGEEEGATARGQHAELFAIGTLAAMADEEPDEALKFLESGRAGALLESLGGRQALRWEDEPEDLRHRREKAEAGERLARAAYVRATQSGKLRLLQERRKTLEAALEKVREVAALTQRTLKSQAQLYYPRAKSLHEIQDGLAPGQALVVYGLCLDRALALVLTQEESTLVALGRAADVIAACNALAAGDPESKPEAALANLRKLLVEPLKLKKDVEQVLVSPEGPLCYVPLAALFEQAVAFTPSGTTHVLLREEHRDSGVGVLALGDPNYAGTSKGPPVYVRGRKLGRIEATADEARAVTQAVGDAVLLRDEANERNFQKALKSKKRWRAVHFACHGLVDPERPTLSSLALTATAEEDGFLTALEVLRMEIPADLAVLSACETGTGKIVKGEGIVGLTRAFMYAGSPRVICSLWKVDDVATQALMMRFYELWKGEKGLSASAALKKAQKHIRDQEKWKHPHYWAAWVLWGLPD